MKKFFVILLTLSLTFSIFAQESEKPSVNTEENRQEASQTETPAENPNEDESVRQDEKEKRRNQTPLEVQQFQPIRKGDKYVKLGIGLGIPLFNTSRGKFAIKTKMYPGPKIFAGMHFYLTNSFSLGGDISFEFYPTIAKNLYFALPISLTFGYTPTYKRWRFPMGMSIGGCFQSYLGRKYFGMYFKPFFSFYYQYSPEWSFGGELNWAITPEWRKETKYNRVHNNLGISFAARYHF